MMDSTDQPDHDADLAGVAESDSVTSRATAPRSSPFKFKKALPTDRSKLETQLAILRAYAAASGDEKKLVDVNLAASTAHLGRDTVSLSNEFFRGSGLLKREGRKFVPCSEVFEYAQAYRLDPPSAGKRLAPILRKSWFGDHVLTCLAVRSTARKHALLIDLGQMAGAEAEHMPRVELLLKYLEVAELIAVSADEVAEVRSADQEVATEEPPPAPAPAVSSPSIDSTPAAVPADSFSITLPGHGPITLALPSTLEGADWEMAASMIDMFIKNERQKKEGSS